MTEPGDKRGVACLACGHKLSRYSATCPNCGTPQPHKRLGSTVGLGAMLALLLGLLLYSVFAGSGAPAP